MAILEAFWWDLILRQTHVSFPVDGFIIVFPANRTKTTKARITTTFLENNAVVLLFLQNDVILFAYTMVAA